jgi:hypothetical protein
MVLPLKESAGLRIWCEASLGQYLWDTLLEIVRELGGMPVGWQAIRDRLYHTTCICSPAKRAKAPISATRCP